jgi:hypothetical protein
MKIATVRVFLGGKLRGSGSVLSRQDVDKMVLTAQADQTRKNIYQCIYPCRREKSYHQGS